MQTVKFSRKVHGDFSKALKQRVNNYFKSNNISQKGNWKMYLKTVAMYSIYFVPYFFILLANDPNYWLVAGAWVMMGFGMAGIGFSIMHDAVHGSYSNKKWINYIMSLSMNVTGASFINWQIKHNMLHHSFTNIDGLDEDIEAPEKLLRFSPNRKLHKIHKFQHIYAWFLYGLLTINWSTLSDFKSFRKYAKKGFFDMTQQKTSVVFSKITVSKIIYFSYVLALPLIFSDVSWWMILLGYVIMHYTAGVILSSIFQPAHVMETSLYIKANENDTVEHTREAHQLMTTTNFATNNKILTWFVGGLNFQIEHHLFPQICHVHYKKISKIVKETAEEFKVPYNEVPSFRKALGEHKRMLKKLGTA